MDDTMETGEGQDLETSVDVPVTDAMGSDPMLITDHAARTRAEKAAKEKAKEPVKEPELKPWESKESKEEKEKGHTPRWARERLREVTGNNRQLKEHVDQLTGTVQQLLKQFQPKARDLKEEDFPDKASFVKHIAEQTVTDTVSKVEQARARLDVERRERESIERAEETNTQAALKHLPDYHDKLEQGDPELRLPVAAIKHLALSPAGPYVKYRIATDTQLSNELKGLSPQAKIDRVSQVHDAVLDWLVKQQGDTQAPPAQYPAQPDRRSAQAPPVARKQAPPAAPPRSRGSGSTTNVDPNSLSGDEYVKWYNTQKRS